MQKKVHVVCELTKSINRHGVKSVQFSQILDGLLHFLALAPVVEDLEIPQWLTQAAFKTKSETLQGARFWSHIDKQSVVAAFFTEAEVHQVQFQAIRGKLVEPTREKTSDQISKVRS